MNGFWATPVLEPINDDFDADEYALIQLALAEGHLSVSSFKTSSHYYEREIEVVSPPKKAHKKTATRPVQKPRLWKPVEIRNAALDQYILASSIEAQALFKEMYAKRNIGQEMILRRLEELSGKNPTA